MSYNGARLQRRIASTEDRKLAARELIIPDGMENIYAEKRYAPGVRVG